MQGIAMFRFIAAVCRNETVASTGGAFFFLVLLLLGGFLLARGGELIVWPTSDALLAFLTIVRAGHLLQHDMNQETLVCCPADIPPWWIWFCELLPSS